MSSTLLAFLWFKVTISLLRNVFPAARSTSFQFSPCVISFSKSFCSLYFFLIFLSSSLAASINFFSSSAVSFVRVNCFSMCCLRFLSNSGL